MKMYFDNRLKSVNSSEVIGRIGQKSAAYSVVNANLRIENFIMDNFFIGLRVTIFLILKFDTQLLITMIGWIVEQLDMDEILL